MSKNGLQYKLIKVFLLQIILISAATLFGVFAAAKVVEDVLLQSALEGEAAYFWKLYQHDTDYPRPNTLNMTGYLAVGADFSEVPEALRHLQPGYTRVDFAGRQPIVYVEDLNAARLFLVFDEEQVANLAFYFGIVPLSLVLILIYLFAWLAYRQTHQAISPIIKLARQVEQFNFREQSLDKLDLTSLPESADSEVLTLIDALIHFTQKIDAFIERERNFTRDASHELRTPLAVIKSSLALLEKRTDFLPNENKAVVLIARTVRDMESLIETLLLLAREESSPLPEENIIVNDLLKTLIEQLQRTINKPQIQIIIEENQLLVIKAPEKVLSILLTNILKNAFSYTEKGQILISIDTLQLNICDSGVGIPADKLQKVFDSFYRVSCDNKGHGLGLAIVKRLCDRFGWSLKVHSKLNEGTCVSVIFSGNRKNS
ncbi:histidine kinase [Methyloprofundus sedimenti]|uniref:histidine kinase n=1 Tax=Methyloprofundus sedimenti TaxID=1420851 RepID=A0A1V8M3X5_9GAMM|nr:HAMP domain-containing sensor histidine kinase [Methyloprofundus sedimenti]OQK16265.1 histidine kinase [Methyloprofundus sedimenti]